MIEGSRWATQESYWSYFTAKRFAVVVQDGQTNVADATVKLLDAQDQVLYEARTDNQGRAYVFAGLFASGSPQGPFRISVAAGGAPTVVAADEQGDAAQIVSLPGATSAPAVLDLMFVVDTTGSMGDELSYLQAELADVIARVRRERGQDLTIRLSVNFYRDVQDEYVVRPFAFSTDIDAQVVDLSAQWAAGGGDTPEAVELGLHDAISNHDWSSSARARLLFLVLDAPPHYTPEIIASLHDSTLAAAQRGVRIVPVVASGADKDTEFLMRFLAIATGGSYTFLTDDSGIGGGHEVPTIGDFQVEPLNSLLSRIISAATAP